MAEDVQGEIAQNTEQPAETPAPEMDANALKAELERVQKALKEANKEAAGRRKRLEELEQAEAKRKELELSEVERLQKQLADITGKAARLERESLQRSIAEKTGLPTAFAARLQGETPEEMEADAKALLEAMPKPTKAPPAINPTNPGASRQVGETEVQMRARLKPDYQDIDRSLAERMGGGVFFNDK